MREMDRQRARRAREQENSDIGEGSHSSSHRRPGTTDRDSEMLSSGFGERSYGGGVDDRARATQSRSNSHGGER